VELADGGGVDAEPDDAPLFRGIIKPSQDCFMVQFHFALCMSPEGGSTDGSDRA
jgi:hypothetical protein